MKKKILSLVLACTMVVSAVNAALLTVSAKPVQPKVEYRVPVYVEDDPYKGVASWTTQYVGGDSGVSYQMFLCDEDTQVSLTNDGFYVVGDDYDGDGDIDIDDAKYGKKNGLQTSFTLEKGLLVNAHINLILADGFTLTSTGIPGTDDVLSVDYYGGASGVTIATNQSLVIYGQKYNSGTLNTNGALRGNAGYSGIALLGTTQTDYESGTFTKLVINGGTVHAAGASTTVSGYTAGDGIAWKKTPTVSNTQYAQIIINDGNITATGGNSYDKTPGYGLYVQAYAPGVINGGNVTATGGSGEKCAGKTAIYNLYLNAGNITAIGGDVKSTPEYNSAGGCGYELSDENLREITWTDKLNLTAIAGNNYSNDGKMLSKYSTGGCGIYITGKKCDLSLTIDGANITAIGATDGYKRVSSDGIRLKSLSGTDVENATLTIKSGKVIAQAGAVPTNTNGFTYTADAIAIETTQYNTKTSAEPGVATINVAEGLIVKAGDSKASAAEITDQGSTGFADDLNNKYIYTSIKTPTAKIGDTEYGSVQEAIDAAGDTATTITMIADDNESITVAENQDITIEMDYHILNGNGTANIANFGTLCIENTGTSGVIRYWVPDATGLWQLQSEKPATGTANVDYYATSAGCITGMAGYNENGNLCGGIYNAGSLTLKSVNIVGNHTDMGAAIYNTDSGSLNVEKCNVVGNVASCVAGGIANRGTATVKGGMVAYNTSDEVGGIWSKGALTLNGTKVTDNITEDTDDDASDNDYPSAGVYSYNGSVTLKGKVMIQNNKSSGEAANMVVAKQSAGLDIANLSDSASIGISKLDMNDGKTTGIFTSGTGANAARAKCFTPDNAEQAVILESGKLSLVDKSSLPMTITADSATKPYDGTALTKDSCTITTGALKKGDTLVTTVAGTITDVGTVANKVTSYKIMRGAQEVTSEYTFETPVDGTLTVTPAAVTVTGTRANGKDYDGTTDADVNLGTVSGLVPGDGVTVTAVGQFDSKDVGNGRNVTVTYTLTGAKAGNYTAPAAETTNADITKRAITLTSGSVEQYYNGSALTKDTVTVTSGSFVDGEGFDYTVTGSQTAIGSSANTFTYSAKSGTDANNYAITKAEGTLTVKEDTTAPEVEIKIDTNKINKLFNQITFGLFFKETQTVTITAADDETGVKSIEYYVADKALTVEEMKAITDWQEYTTPFSINPDAKAVVYARVSNNSTLTAIVNSDGLVLDATAPIISGITDGATYYTTQEFTADDALSEVKAVTVNGVEVTELTLAGDVDEVYTIVVTDNSDNTAEYTVTMKPIASLDDAIDSLTKDNVTASDKDTLDDIKAFIDGLDTADATEDESDALKDITDRCDELLKVIDETAAAIQDAKDASEQYNLDSVVSEDKEDITQAIDAAKAIDADNMTPEQKIDLAAYVKVLENAKASVEKVEDVIESIQNLPEAGAAALSDETEINKAYDAYNALSEHEKSLLSEDVLGKLNAVKSAVDTLYKNCYAPEIVEGAKQVLDISKGISAAFTSSAPGDQFVKLVIDGSDVDAKYYEVQGSTVVTLKNDFIAGLKNGEHTISIVSANGHADSVFTVIGQAEAVSPKTGESSALALWLALFAVSAVGLLFTLKSKKSAEK